MTNVYYIGDSTVQLNKIDTYPQTGMSQVLHLYMADHVQVVPNGKNGCSTKSFIEEGRFLPVQATMKAGDFLLIQFGHNDEKSDALRHTEPFEGYQRNLRYFIQEARSADAFPVLITPIARRLFDEAGTFLPGSHGQYPDAMRQVGHEMQVPVADLTLLTEGFLEEMGELLTRPLFVWPVDNTHLQYQGAVRFAGFLTDELRRFGSPYADILLDISQEKKGNT